MSLPLISLVHLIPRKSSTPRLGDRDGQRGWPFINPLMVMKCSFVSIGVVFHKYQGWNSLKISRYDRSHDTIFIAKLKRSPAVSAYCTVVCLSPFHISWYGETKMLPRARFKTRWYICSFSNFAARFWLATRVIRRVAKGRQISGKNPETFYGKLSWEILEIFQLMGSDGN